MTIDDMHTDDMHTDDMYADDMYADDQRVMFDSAVVVALAELSRHAPPTALRSSTLAAARRRRPAGTPTATPMTPVEAFRRAVDDLDVLLGELEPQDWEAAAPNGTVRSLIGHLGGVEQYMLSVVGQAEHPDPAHDTDHVRVTTASINAADGEASDVVRNRWRQRADAVIAAGLARSMDETLPLHGLPVTTGGAFLLRTFEVWTHTEDICRALGRRLMPPEADRIELMSSSLCAVVVGGMHLAGVPRKSGRLTIRLTGSGGGTYSHTLGPDGSGPEVSIEADVVDICRLAARRIAPADLDAVIIGDADLAADVLVGLTAFAMD